MKRYYDYNGTVYIDYNEREVEVNLSAKAWEIRMSQRYYDFESDESEIEEVNISEAHYTDTNEAVAVDEIYSDVEKHLNDHFSNYFNDDERDCD